MLEGRRERRIESEGSSEGRARSGKCVLNPEQAAIVEEVVSQPVPRLRAIGRGANEALRGLKDLAPIASAGNRGPSMDESCARSLAESRSRWRQAIRLPRDASRSVDPLYSSIAPEAREREG